MTKEIQEAVVYIQGKISCAPDIGLILGSGLGEYADRFSAPVIIPYTDIPHFPPSTVRGHKGQLVFQDIDSFTVVAMQGRFHYYEGYSMPQLTFPVRVLGRLGIRHLIVTNAAGGINPEFAAGDLMLITDHINLMGDNPLRGPHDDDNGPRFPDMTEAYNRDDARIFERVAEQIELSLKRGVYAGLGGPSYETPSEINMLRTLGADAVGMSTVPEVIVANQMGIRVIGISCITNMAAGMSSGKLAHEEVMDTANRVKQQFMALIDGAIRRLAEKIEGEKGRG